MAQVEPVSLDPLRSWALVVAVCAVVLILVAVALWIRQRQIQQRRLLRGAATLVTLAALGAVALAVRTWTVYQYYSTHDVVGRSPPLSAYLVHIRVVRQAIAFYQAAGWAAVTVTGVLLVCGAVVAIKRPS